MTPIAKKWFERVQAPEISHGHVQAFYQTVYPRSEGFEPGGKRTNLTPSEARDIVTVFRVRVRDIDGGPRITDTADQGREWLAKYAKRHGMPDLDYRAIIEFRLCGVELDEIPGGWNRARCAPRYSAKFPDGSIIRYAPYAWQDGCSHMLTWAWIKDPAHA